jgi:3-phenylpropionate/trans-cinnamate dioxygenase ferredoxin subunit
VSEFIAVCSLDDVPAGEMRSFHVEGEDVAVAHLDGEIYAFGDVCTHAECSLAEGDLEETLVICPCHGSEFDVRTGEVFSGPATEAVPSFEVLVEDGSVKVAL